MNKRGPALLSRENLEQRSRLKKAEGEKHPKALRVGALRHGVVADRSRTLAVDGPAALPPPGSGSAELARHALELGQQALKATDFSTAMRWLDRASRLAPRDGNILMALATACLHRDPARAAMLFHDIAKAEDIRAAWLGLAAARLATGDALSAASALAEALSRHAPEIELVRQEPSLADTIARAAHAPGWCCLTGDGRLTFRLANPGATEVYLDESRCEGVTLPAGWTAHRQVSVTMEGHHLLGSPIDIRAIRHVAGFVEARAGGIHGWAWYPGDPDTSPQLEVRAAAGGPVLHLTATDLSTSVSNARTLARPRGFEIPASMLAPTRGLIHVCGRDGAELLGSPLDPGAMQAAARVAARSLAWSSRAAIQGETLWAPALPADLLLEGPAPLASPAVAQRRRKPAAVVIPVYGQQAAALACLETVFASLAPKQQIIVIDDASPEHALREALDGLARQRRIRLLRHDRNLGFPASVNDGIAAAPRSDIVLLNSDTLVPPDWLDRLRDAAYSALDIGTATPLSNHASILSYPGPAGCNPVPDLAKTMQLDALARRANPGTIIDIPVGVGFCLYLRRDCIDAVGQFRAEIFAQGYGEENDFCLRARHLGWRHVAVPGLFVAHIGASTFGRAGRHLQVRNEELLNRLHPGFDRLVAAYSQTDPLADARRRLDLLRWRAASPRRSQGSAILVTHEDGGGVERQVALNAERYRTAGLRPILLRPEHAPDGVLRPVVVDGSGFPNLRYSIPAEMPALLRLLRGSKPRVVEVHHTLHHPPGIYDVIRALGTPYDVFIHDYPWFCPQVSLVGATRRYCGEPPVSGCEACVADFGRIIDEPITVSALRERSAGFLTAARRVVAPSADAARRIRAHFPGLAVDIVPQDDDASIPLLQPPRPQEGRCRVCVLGAIGVHKGYDVLLACARDAAERNLRLEFVVVGHSIDDARLLATGRVFITGRFRPGEAVALVRAQHASIALLPSIWPETWSFTLTELWQAGLCVAAFDFGAPAERIRQTGRGLLFPIGLPARAINNALVAAVGLTGHEEA